LPLTIFYMLFVSYHVKTFRFGLNVSHIWINKRVLKSAELEGFFPAKTSPL
jgi:hypothetical protein